MSKSITLSMLLYYDSKIKQDFLVLTNRFKEPQICWLTINASKREHHVNVLLFSPIFHEHAGNVRMNDGSIQMNSSDC